MDKATFLKIAYRRGYDLGITEENNFEKDAFVGSLISKALPWLAKGTVAASKAAPAATKSPGILKNLGSLLGFGGKGTIGYRMAKPISWLPGMSREGAHQALGFGMFGGGIGAVSAEEGDRLSGFAKGFGLGTLGGTGWHYGQKGSQAMLRGLANTGGKDVGGWRKAMRTVTTAPKKGTEDLRGLGKIMQSSKGPLESAKLLGARGLYGGTGLGVGLLASGAVEENAKEHLPFLQSQTPTPMQRATRAPYRSVRNTAQNHFGLTPGAVPGMSSGTTPGAY